LASVIIAVRTSDQLAASAGSMDSCACRERRARL
jgi:hypothetical protein